MADVVQIKGLKFRAVCGAFPEEQLSPQPFEIDLDLEADQVTPANSDNLSDAIDYGPICDSIVKIGANQKFALIESMAQRIVDELFAVDPKIDAISVTLKKLQPAMEVELSYSAVTIRRVR